MFKNLVKFVVAVAASSSIFAAPVLLRIDPSQSEITLSGKVVGSPIQEQGAGSLTTHFEGTLQADLTGSSIQILSGKLDAQPSGDWAPGINGVDGTAQADFGGKAVSLFSSINGALRDIVIDVSSDPLPVSAGSFDATKVAFTFPADSKAGIDVSGGLTPQRFPLANLSAQNLAQAASVTDLNGGQKLTMSLDAQFDFSLLFSNDSSLQLKGQIVATIEQPLAISEIKFADKKLVLSVDGSGSVQLQSSTDLKIWGPRSADRTAANGKTVLTLEPQGSVEFFRLAQ